ncbi:MAG: NAD-dependent epimerase/dehydratase family protein [Oscillospiraceae bacterium]|nr:NAD-dependent epimerase/dehydratase family protein [Oscillospiraceae bacterium]
MKFLIIGGTGHVGTFLTKILYEQGHDVYIGHRGSTKIPEDPVFSKVSYVTCDSWDLAEMEALSAREHFDVIVDFPGTIWNVWQAFRNNADHIISCGSVWMFGCPKVIPTPERYQGPCPFDIYEERNRAYTKILAESRTTRAVFSAVMPPNISGPGKTPLDTLGGRDEEVHRANMRGEKVYLPEGPEATICPCDAYDLAMLFALAANDRVAADGQIFNGGTGRSLTATEYVDTFARIHGVEIPIEYVPWEVYKNEISPGIGYWWHFYAHMTPDITKAKTLLGYRPRYTSEEAMARGIAWMKEQKLL